MSEPYLGEIKMFAGNFAPIGWAMCDGQLLQISSNPALFSLFGTIYGGDGRNTFALPDLRGRLPVHAGNGPGLTQRREGQSGGVEEVTLNGNQIPSHTHAPQAIGATGSLESPANAIWADGAHAHYTTDRTVDGTMHNDALLPAGSSQSHSNLMPFLPVNFIVSLSGTFPSRS